MSLSLRQINEIKRQHQEECGVELTNQEATAIDELCDSFAMIIADQVSISFDDNDREEHNSYK
jgi:hypothetical protein